MRRGASWWMIGGMSSAVDEKVAEAVRAWRAVHRVRQQDLADQLGMARNTVAALERGDRRVTLDDARRLCVVMDCGLTDLVDDDTATALRLRG